MPHAPTRSALSPSSVFRVAALIVLVGTLLPASALAQRARRTTQFGVVVGTPPPTPTRLDWVAAHEPPPGSSAYPRYMARAARQPSLRESYAVPYWYPWRPDTVWTRVASAVSPDGIASAIRSLQYTARGESRALDAREHLFAGLLYERLGRSDSAEGHYTQALTGVRNRLADRHGWASGVEGALQEARYHVLAGRLHATLGVTDSARLQLQRALELQERFLDRDGAGWTALNIGVVEEGHGDSRAAVRMYREAYRKLAGAGQPGGAALAARAAGSLYRAADHMDSATTWYRLAVEQARARPGPFLGATLEQAATALVGAGDRDEGLARFHEALAYYQQAENVSGTLRATYQIAQLHEDMESLDSALTYYRQMQVLAREVGTPALKDLIEESIARTSQARR